MPSKYESVILANSLFIASEYAKPMLSRNFFNSPVLTSYVPSSLDLKIDSNL